MSNWTISIWLGAVFVLLALIVWNCRPIGAPKPPSLRSRLRERIFARACGVNETGKKTHWPF